MSIDLLDDAFLRRLARDRRRAPAPVVRRPPAVRPGPATAPEAPTSGDGPAASPALSASRASIGPAARPTSHDDPFVERLLGLVPEEWTALADHVEEARRRGRRVIAVAGSRAGEGRTTLVRCLAATLRARGRDVTSVAPHELADATGRPVGGGAAHDKRIVLVDAGIWFPPGPIRRSLVQVASLGCEAAILVRRAGASGSLARQAALEALGIEVLGEVLTFGALPAGATADGGAAA